MSVQFQGPPSSIPQGGIPLTPMSKGGTPSGTASPITVNKANSVQKPPTVSKASPTLPLVGAKSTVPLGGVQPALEGINGTQSNNPSSTAINKPVGTVVQRMTDMALSLSALVRNRLPDIKSLPAFLKGETIKHAGNEYVIATTRSGGIVVQEKNEYADPEKKSGLFIGSNGTEVKGTDQQCLEALKIGLNLQNKDKIITKLKDVQGNRFQIPAVVQELAEACKNGAVLTEDDKKLLLSIKKEKLDTFEVKNMSDGRFNIQIEGASRTIAELTGTAPKEPPKTNASTEGPSAVAKKEPPKMDDGTFKSSLSSMQFSGAWDLGRHENEHLDSLRDKMADAMNTICGAEVFGRNSFSASSLDHNTLYITVNEGSISTEELVKKLGARVKDTNPVNGRNSPTLAISMASFETVRQVLLSGKSAETLRIETFKANMQSLQTGNYNPAIADTFLMTASIFINQFKDKQLTEDDKKFLMDIKSALEAVAKHPDTGRKGVGYSKNDIQAIDKMLGIAPKELSSLETYATQHRADIDKIQGKKVVTYEGKEFIIERTPNGGLRVQNYQDWRESKRSGIFIESNNEENPNRGKAYGDPVKDEECFHVLMMAVNEVSTKKHMH